MELIIQKAVELGVCQVIPVETKRCVVRLDGKRLQKGGTVAADRRERGQAVQAYADPFGSSGDDL